MFANLTSMQRDLLVDVLTFYAGYAASNLKKCREQQMPDLERLWQGRLEQVNDWSVQVATE